MTGADRQTYRYWALRITLAALLGVAPRGAHAQEALTPPRPLSVSPTTQPVPFAPPAVSSGDRPLPINLPTALQLANVRAVDVLAAAERVRVAAAMLEQAQVLWLPTITLGGDYNRHDGRNQDTMGNVFANSRSSMMLGAGTGIGPAAVLDVGEAIFAPLVARQRLQAREADANTASNDTLVAVSDAYFNVQQARGELAGAADATRRTEDLVQRTRKLAPAIVPELETDRAETELARRRQAEDLARERWKVASAELLRVLRLDPAAQVEPAEPPHLRVDLIDLTKPMDDLIALGLLNRPELTSRQADVRATLALLRQEKLRPLIPSILLRGYSTPVTGTLAAGYFGGGPNDSVGNAGLRSDLDLQLLWQLNNLGLGNRARVHQREAEKRLAVIELLRVEDRVAAEVAQAHAQALLAARRVQLAESEIRWARTSADKNLLALGQPKAAGGPVQLLVRPLEAVASVQALAQAYTDLYGAVADYDRAQFRLYRALGNPAQALAAPTPPPPAPPGACDAPVSLGGPQPLRAPGQPDP